MLLVSARISYNLHALRSMLPRFTGPMASRPHTGQHVHKYMHAVQSMACIQLTQSGPSRSMISGIAP